MFKKLLFVLFVLTGLLSSSFVLSIQSLGDRSVVINEIAWMGTESSYTDEWIELCNNTDVSVNLNGWQLIAADGSPNVDLTETIPAKGFYLLERTDDNSVPKIPASQIYTGVLENKGETLELYDNLGNLIDQVDCSSGWFAGDNKTKQTMEKKDSKSHGSHPGDWQKSQNPGGTPKAKNSIGFAEVNPPQTQSQQDLLSQAPLKAKKKPSLSLFVLFSALSVATFSGIAILTLKKEIKKRYN